MTGSFFDSLDSGAQHPEHASLPTAESQACRTASYLDEVQDLLAYAARCPLPVPEDLADGRPHPTNPEIIEIPLNNAPGHFAWIDAEDYPLVRRYRWRLDGKYAGAGDGLRMHRVILMLGKSAMHVDHRDHNRLDNRKSNLRACTPAQNSANSRRLHISSTGVKGVSRTKYGKWHAKVSANGVLHWIELDDFDAACEWVAQKRQELHGEFACAQ